jgi:predicted glycoside hydrolase/deacetylase ChbG (UPF0249 family)
VLSTGLLGFSPEARVLINADDLGMYSALNLAVLDAVEQCVASSSSIMAPCAGAPEALRLLTERPHIRFGVHLTLVSDAPLPAGSSWPGPPRRNRH